MVSMGWLGLSVGMPCALPLANLARALMPIYCRAFVVWAPSSIMCQCSSWVSHSNNTGSRVWSSVPPRMDNRWALVCYVLQSSWRPCSIGSWGEKLQEDGSIYLFREFYSPLWMLHQRFMASPPTSTQVAKLRWSHFHIATYHDLC